MTTNDTRNHALKRISQFFINNYKITIILMIGVIFFGLYSLVAVRRDGFPQINIPVYVITATYPGASASDIEEQIITPVEKEIQEIDGIEEFQSTTRNNFGSIVVTASTDADFETVKAEIKASAEKVNLPENAENLEFSEAGFDDQPFMYIGMIGGESQDDLQSKAELLQSKIEEIDGIKKVIIDGARDERVEIVLDLEKTKENNISVASIKDVFNASNINFPGGQIEQEDGFLPIETKGEIRSVEEIGNLEIPTGASSAFGQAGSTIKLSEIATIEKTFETGSESSVAGVRTEEGFQAGSALTLGVVKQTSKDLVDVSRDVNALMDEKNPDIFAENVNYFIGYDTADSVNEQITDLTNNALLGSIVIIIVLSFFVSLRGSIVAAVAIPMVMLITFGAFNFVGYSFNTITLFSLLITLGLLVDNAIVIVEGIQHNLEKGMSKKKAAIKAVADVGPAVFAATLTTVLVFVPIAFFPGVTGQFIRYIPITIIISIISSFVVAILITPFIGSILMKLSKRQKSRIEKRGMHNTFISKFGDHLEKNINSMPRMIIVLVASFVVLFAGITVPFATGSLQFEMWPPQDDADFAQVTVEFPNGTKVDQRNEITKNIINDLGEVQEIDSIILLSFGGGQGKRLTLTFDADKDRKATEIVEELQELTGQKDYSVPQGEVEVTPELLAEGPPQAEFEVVVRVLDDNLDALKTASNQISEELLENENIDAVENTIIENQVEKISIQLDEEKIEDEQAQKIAVASSIRSIFSEEKIGEIRSENGESDEVYIRYNKEVTDSIDDVKEVPIQTVSGSIELQDVADIEKVSDARSIKHYNGKRFIEINLDTADGAAQLVQQYIQNEYFTSDKFEELGIKDGAIEFGGQSSEEMEELGNLLSAFIIAMLLVYIVLVAQFKSFMQPALIVLSVLFSLAFVFPGLVVTGNALSFFAMLGVIALIGIVVNDSIVLIDAINRYRSEDGMPAKKAIVEGIKQRFKPILATSLTTIAGVLPLALANPFMSALGYALVFGLISSTIFTLYAVPVAYAPATTIYRWIKNKSKRSK